MGLRKKRRMRLRLFVSYAHEDGKYLETLRNYLELLRTEGLIEVWTDKDIVPGKQWDEEMRRELDISQIVVFLVSTLSLGSKYIRRVEVTSAKRRHRGGKAVVVPVILEQSSWEKTWRKFQVPPEGGRPVRAFGRRDVAWHTVELGLRKVIDGFLIKCDGANES